MIMPLINSTNLADKDFLTTTVNNDVDDTSSMNINSPKVAIGDKTDNSNITIDSRNTSPIHKKIIFWLIIGGIILIIGVSGYILGNTKRTITVELKDDMTQSIFSTSPVIQNITTEPLSTTSENEPKILSLLDSRVIELDARLKYKNLTDPGIGMHWEKKDFTDGFLYANQLNEETKFELIWNQLKLDGIISPFLASEFFNSFTDYQKVLENYPNHDYPVVVIISDSQFNNAVAKVFGPVKVDGTYVNAIGCFAYDAIRYCYDEINNNYYGVPFETGREGLAFYDAFLVKAEETNSGEIKLYTKPFFFLGEAGDDIVDIKKSADAETALIRITRDEYYKKSMADLLTSYYDQLDTYVYTFKPNNKGGYYFYNVQLQEATEL